MEKYENYTLQNIVIPTLYGTLAERVHLALVRIIPVSSYRYVLLFVGKRKISLKLVSTLLLTIELVKLILWDVTE